MLYKLSIKPTRLELLKLIALDKSTYKEIRVAVRPLPFRFNRGIIDSTDFFQQFVDILNDFLETYRQDISELFVSLKEHYFQVHKLPMQEFGEDLLHWEIAQYITDDPSSYKYGTYFDSDEQKLQVIIVRTKLIDYFNKVIKSLNGKIHFTALGFDLKSTKSETVFIKTDKDIVDFYRFGYAGSWSPDNEAVETKRKFPKSLVIGSSFAVLVALLLIWIWPQISTSEDKPVSLTKTVDTAHKPNETAKDTASSIVNPAPSVDSKLTQPNINSGVYSLISSLSALNFNSLVINSNSIQLELSGEPETKKAIEILKANNQNSVTSTVGKNNILICSLTDLSYYQQNPENMKKLIQLSDKSNLSNKFNYRLFNNSTALIKFLTDLQSNDIKFSHLVLSHRGSIYSLALEFQ